jgi:hypothetical protein
MKLKPINWSCRIEVSIFEMWGLGFMTTEFGPVLILGPVTLAFTSYC